jgi:PKD repeat protein
VNLTASNANGTSSKLATINVLEQSIADTINVTSLPVANFTSNVTNGTAPLSIQFNDNSTGNVTSWFWEFGDNTTNSSEQNPMHTYVDAGNYTVNLTVSNANGVNSKTSTINVTSKILPVADFFATPTSGTIPLQVSFTDNSTGSPTSWEWSFGDKATSIEQNPKHTYSKQGKYTVILKVTNADGNNSVTKYSYISVSKK